MASLIIYTTAVSKNIHINRFSKDHHNLCVSQWMPNLLQSLRHPVRHFNEDAHALTAGILNATYLSPSMLTQSKLNRDRKIVCQI
jgi:hypothetical protein